MYLQSNNDVETYTIITFIIIYDNTVMYNTIYITNKYLSIYLSKILYYCITHTVIAAIIVIK
jgi:hypothetical protein